MNEYEDDHDYEDNDEEENESESEMRGPITSEVYPNTSVIKRLYEDLNNFKENIAESKNTRDSLIENFKNDPIHFIEMYNEHRIGNIFPIKYLNYDINPNKAKIASDLSLLNSSFDCQINHITSGRIIFTTNVVMSCKDLKRNFCFNYNFGKFQFDLEISLERMPKYKLTAYLVGENVCRGNLYHPHIRHDGDVCIGGYSNEIAKDILIGNYIEIIYNICEIMSQYNPTSGFGEPIDSWIGTKCPVCSSLIPNDSEDSVKCAKTANLIHKEGCSKEIDGQFYSALVVKTCSVCDKESPMWVSNNKKIFCEGCI